MSVGSVGSLVTTVIGVKYDGSGANLAKAGFVDLTNKANNLSNALKSGVVDSANKLAIALKQDSVVGAQFVGTLNSMSIGGKKVTGVFDTYRVAIQAVNGELLYTEKTLERVSKKIRYNDPRTGRINWRTETKYKVMDTPASLQPVGMRTVEKMMDKPTSLLGDMDLGKLALRAAATIPTWMALRSGITSVIDVIPTAINRFKELNSAVAEMKVLTDGANSIGNFSDVASTALNKLSRETGIAVQDLKGIYTAISSTGIDAQTSLSAMETVAKGGLATGADSKQLASTMAGLINTMGDTLQVGTTKGEKFKELMVILHSAMKTNAGSMNDFAEALSQAGATASTSGMTISELVANVAVLQTAMVKSGMGGTALRTALDQVVQKRQEVSDLLGGITPDQDKSQFTLVLAVVDKLREFASSGDITNANKYMQSIFGVKAGKDVNVLRNNLEKFKDTFAEINRLVSIGQTQGIGAMMSQLTADYTERVTTLEQQQKRFAQITAELQSSLVSGFFGRTGDDWLSNFEEFNNGLNSLISSVNKFGETLREVAIGAFVLSLAKIPSILKAIHTAALALSANPVWKTLAVAGLAISTIQSAKEIGTAVGENRAERTLSARQSVAMRARQGVSFEQILSELEKDKLIKKSFSPLDVFTGKSGALNIKDKAIYDDLLNTYRNAKQAQTAELGKIVITGGSKPSGQSGISTPEDRMWNFKTQVANLEKLKQYGIDSYQIKQKEMELLKIAYTGEELITKQKEYQLELDKMKLAEQQKYYDSLQSSIKDSLLNNLQGKDSNLFADIGKNFTSQLQNSMAENMSRVIMSTGIGDVMTAPMQFLDEGANRITDPILKAHVDGGQRVHDLIVSAFDKVTGKQTASSGGKIGTAGFGGSGNALPGIWGTSTFTQGASREVTLSNGQKVQSSTITPGTKPGTPNFWGKAGAYGTIAAGTAITAQSSIQQMQGGGAKNIVGGAGQLGMALGSGIMAATSAGLISSTGMLAAAGPIGMALGAVLIIASMFMKGAKSTQTSTQTSETKVGSKISLTNQKLDLVNRNLLALRNSFETYALSTSSYFSEKNGSIDSNFALAGKRSYA